MSTMSDYCKAYPVERLRQYSGWEEAASNEPLALEECVFIHDNLVVTRGVFKDEQILFDRVTDEWRAFCENALAFSVPTFD